MPNRLAGEKSPYLLQHAENPVAWYPWGEEAFRKATKEDKPIFLSIGYSTCHWCHVMEHESFEDEEVAALLNEHFVSIKVDREERPDVDQVYMSVCQAITGRGGWPLSVFMSPDRKPFYAGSYFPKTGRRGMPGFVQLINQLSMLWRERRDQLDHISAEITAAIQPGPAGGGASVPGVEVLERAYTQLRRSFDFVWGGFGAAPKFPTPHNLTFLLRWHGRNRGAAVPHEVEKTLDSMRAGGIFDHVGFGFHRYSVDERWLVPHFEKMLYDQALLAMAYTEASLASGADRYARVAREVLEYVLRDMKSPEGGFYSAEDADSEGGEGLFYTWTPSEIAGVLGGDDAGICCRAFGISEKGNFEDGRSIPHTATPVGELARTLGISEASLDSLLEGCRSKLFAAREKRVHPLKDDKILVAWNGLMIAALSRGFQAFGNAAYLLAAKEAADFILKTMRPGGRLHRRYRQGDVAHLACADDYAFLIWGLLDLYESAFDTSYLSGAVQLQEEMNALFEDPDGGFFYTGKDAEDLIVRDKPLYDGATPSANSASALNLTRLGLMTGNTAFEKRADLLLRCFSGQVSVFPPAYTYLLQAIAFSLGPVREILIAGHESDRQTREMIEVVHHLFLPNRVLLLKDAGEGGRSLAEISPFTKPMEVPEHGAAAYVCESFRCRRPVFDTNELRTILQE